MCAQDNAQKIPYRSSTVVCIGVQWNNSDLSGCTPGGGCSWAYFEVLGGGVRVRLTRGVII